MHWWRFSASSAAPDTLHPSHDAGLVALSVFVATLAAFTALAVVNRMLATRSVAAQRAWLALGAVNLGAGIWAMHFTGMLAYRLPIPVDYSLGWTLVSLVPAIVGGALGLRAMARDSIGYTRLVAAGLALAVGIGAMHYSGMEALLLSADLLYSPALFALSIVVALILSIAALYTRFALRSVKREGVRHLLAAALMGAAVSGMHYTAMAAASFVPSSAPVTLGAGVNHAMLALSVVAISTLLAGMALAVVAVDRRLSEEQARTLESEERHRAMLHSMREGLITVNASGTIEAANPAAAATLGYTPEDLVGRRFLELVKFPADVAVGSDGDQVHALQAVILNHPAAEARRSDGEPLRVLLRLHQVSYGHRQLLDILMRDTSAEYAAEMERKRLSEAVKQSANAVFITDRHGRIEYVNPAFETILGYSRDEAVGQSPKILNSGRQDPGFYSRLWSTILAGDVWSGLVVNRAKGGAEVELMQVISPIKDDAGAVTHFVSAARDVTAERAMEWQLGQANKLEAIGQLAAGIAHEINTPIQYVGDNVRFLQGAIADLLAAFGDLQALQQAVDRDGAYAALSSAATQSATKADTAFLREEVPQAIEQTLEGVTRVATIVRAMKEFSHPGKAKQRVDLNRAIENTITVATNEWKYVASVETDLASDLPQVECTVGEINQVVLNLLVNAAHAIQSTRTDASPLGKIRVSTRAEADHFVIRIADSGGGIPEPIRARIFDPFFTTKELGRGTGQGLTLAHTVVTRKHGGTIDFQSEMGVGTTFTVRLPLVSALEEAA